MAQDVRELSFRQGMLFGGLFSAAGLAVVLLSAGVIETAEDSLKVPRWIGVLIGLAFLLTGAYMILVGIYNRHGIAATQSPTVSALAGVVASAQC